MGTINIILQLILSLSILVVLHELGHFLPAKWFKTRVEKFYLFFDPWFSLFKVNKGGTEYGVGWLPLGGYVKISGMIDESMDKEQMEGPIQPWEFRAKKPWQKLIIMAGGVTVNFILGILLFAMIGSVWGEDYLTNDQLKYGINVSSLGEEIGLKDGDKLIQVGDRELEKFSSGTIRSEIILNDARSITVIRDGKQVKVPISDEQAQELSTYAKSQVRIAQPRVPAVIGFVGEDYPADQAGLQVDDKIIEVNGQPISYFDQAQKLLNKKENTAQVKIIRDGREMSFSIDRKRIQEPGLIAGIMGASPDTVYTLGISPPPLSDVYDLQNKKYTGLSSLTYGFQTSFGFLGDQINAFGKMFSGKIKAKESLGGFITIAKIFPKKWDWHRFWRMTAILSLILGFMNLLPIPALDGGHILFLLIEMITGKKFSDKFMERATTIGFIVLIILLIYVNGLDVARLFQ